MKKSGAGLDDCDVKELVSKLKAGNKAAREWLFGLGAIKDRVDKINEIIAKFHCGNSAGTDRAQQQMLDQQAGNPALDLEPSEEMWDKLEYNLLLIRQKMLVRNRESDKAGDDASAPEELVESKLDLLELWSGLPADKQRILRAWINGNTSSVRATPEFAIEELEAAQKALVNLLASKR